MAGPRVLCKGFSRVLRLFCREVTGFVLRAASEILGRLPGGSTFELEWLRAWVVAEPGRGCCPSLRLGSGQPSLVEVSLFGLVVAAVWPVSNSALWGYVVYWLGVAVLVSSSRSVGWPRVRSGHEIGCPDSLESNVCSSKVGA